MLKSEKIHYLELPAKDIEIVKTFYSGVFDWSFVDYGDEYVAFNDAGLAGGFYQSDLKSTTDKGGVLVVLYSDDLAKTQTEIESAGGKITKPVFSFPGGKRFHFSDPNGNELAVWSKESA